MSGWVRFHIVAWALLCALAGCTDEPIAAQSLGRDPPSLSTPPRGLLIGDSILDQHGNHARVALHNMGVDATVLGVWGSSLFTRNQYDCGEVQLTPHNDDFAWLHEASALIERVDPDLVFVYLNHNFLPEYPRTAEQCETPEDDVIALGSPDFVKMTGELLREFLRRLRARDARVVFGSPLPMNAERAADNPIFNAYLTFQEELDFDVVDVSEELVSESGTRVDTVADCDGIARRVRPETDNHLTYFGAGLMGSTLAQAVARELGLADKGISAPAERPTAVLSAPQGYRVVTCDAGTFAFGQGVVNAGGAAFAAERPPSRPAVAAATTPSGAGYALLFSTGRVLRFGDAPDLGSAEAAFLGGGAATGIGFTPNGAGYWVASSRGSVVALGDAPVLGDLTLTDDSVVGMASLPAREGYWLVTKRGKVAAFGAACHFGDLTGVSLSDPIVGVTAHPQGGGYWLVDRAGRVFSFGQARDHGSALRVPMIRIVDPRDNVEEVVVSNASAVGIAATASGDGYHVLMNNGAVCHFGDAPRRGSLYRIAVNGMMVWGGEPRYRGDSICE